MVDHMKLGFSIYQPANGVLRDKQKALIVGNSINAKHDSDTGEIAQQAATALGVTAIALSREQGHNMPFTPSDLAIRRRLSRGEIRSAFRFADQIEQELNTLGIKDTDFIGQSGGAWAVLALARTEAIRSASFMYMSEVPGLTRISNPVHSFANQQKRQAEIIRSTYPGLPDKWPWTKAQLDSETAKKSQRLILPFDDHIELLAIARMRRNTSIATQFIGEYWYYQLPWSRGNVVDELEQYVESLPPTQLDIAHNSMVLPTSNPYEFSQSFEAATRLKNLADTPDSHFRFSILPNTVHCSFDNRVLQLSRYVLSAAKQGLPATQPDYYHAYPLLRHSPGWFQESILVGTA